jgi:hypothetical protein
MFHASSKTCRRILSDKGVGPIVGVTEGACVVVGAGVRVSVGAAVALGASVAVTVGGKSRRVAAWQASELVASASAIRIGAALGNDVWVMANFVKYTSPASKSFASNFKIIPRNL